MARFAGKRSNSGQWSLVLFLLLLFAVVLAFQWDELARLFMTWGAG